MGVRLIDDPDRGQVSVEWGIGRVTKLEPRGDRNAQVTIDAEHLKQYPVTAWVDRQGPTFPRVEQALAQSMRVWYRVDVHRKDKVDQALPLAQVGNRDKVRDLVDLRRDVDAPADGFLGAAPADPPPAPAPAAPAAPGPTQASQAAGSGPAPDGAEHAARLKWLEQLDEAVRKGEPPQVVRYLADTALELGASQRSVDSIVNAARRDVARSGATATAPPDVDVRDDSTSGQIERTRDGNDPRWQTDAPPADTPPPAEDDPHVAALRAKLDQHGPDSPIGKAAADRLRQLGVAVKALASAKDPDRVGDQRPASPNLTDSAPAAAPARPVSPVSGLTRQQRPIASDNRPWEITNSDGRLNLSSYAAGAVMEVTNLAGRLLITRARARYAEDPATELHAPTEDQVLGLASTLLNVADTVQHRMRGGGRVDRMAASHRLARQALREAIDLYPVPWGADRGDVDAWRDDLITHATSLVNVAVRLLEGTIDEAATG